ncbi:MAG: transglycosylase SLT domain-containing protein [Bacteriovoracaceae bacterium]
MNYIYEDLKDKYKYKTLKKIKGFPQDKGQYDQLIQFWLKYWKNQGLIKEDIDPLLVKAIIAIESSFRERVITKMPGSSATGLMQILKKTMRILARKLGNEVRKANIDITQEEAREVNTNIAAGTRWLIYKVTTSPWKKKKLKKDRMYGGVRYYHSWDKEGEKYANKVFDLYEKSKN